MLSLIDILIFVILLSWPPAVDPNAGSAIITIVALRTHTTEPCGSHLRNIAGIRLCHSAAFLQHIRRTSAVATTADQSATSMLQYGVNVIGGSDALHNIVTNAKFLHPPVLNDTEFMIWLKMTAERKLQTDNEFIERIFVRELRRQNLDVLLDLEGKFNAAKAAFEGSSKYEQLHQLDRQIAGGEQAISSIQNFINEYSTQKLAAQLTSEGTGTIIECAGSDSMTASSAVTNVGAAIEAQCSGTGPNNFDVGTAGAVAAAALSEKILVKLKRVGKLLPQKIAEVQEKASMRELIRGQSLEYVRYKQAEEACQSFYQQIGLNEAMNRIATVQHSGGRGRNSRGKTFEDIAADVINEFLVPKLAAKHNISSGDIYQVRNIKFGMTTSKGSTAELDCVICARSPRPERLDPTKPRGVFCKVLAVVEVKRNADDIGEAFAGYQLALRWLSGKEDMYDSSTWITKGYPTGHFKCRPFVQECNGAGPLIFTPESFSGLQLTTADGNIGGLGTPTSTCRAKESSSDFSTLLFIEDLYFVARSGSVECLPSKAASWALSKVSYETNFDMELSDADAVKTLRERVNERYPHRLSVLEVLQLYNTHNLLEQLYLVGKFNNSD